MIDALHQEVAKISFCDAMRAELEQVLLSAGYATVRLTNRKRLVLITGHRRENFGDGFLSMCSAIKALNEKYFEMDFVYPMHLTPNVRRPIGDVFGETPPGNMFFHRTS